MKIKIFVISSKYIRSLSTYIASVRKQHFFRRLCWLCAAHRISTKYSSLMTFTHPAAAIQTYIFGKTNSTVSWLTFKRRSMMNAAMCTPVKSTLHHTQTHATQYKYSFLFVWMKLFTWHNVSWIVFTTKFELEMKRWCAFSYAGCVRYARTHTHINS